MEQEPNILKQCSEMTNHDQRKPHVRNCFVQSFFQHAFFVRSISVDMNYLKGWRSYGRIRLNEIGAVEKEIDHFVRFIVVEEKHRSMAALTC